MSFQTEVLTVNIAALGADVLWRSCGPLHTQDHAAASFTENDAPAACAWWMGETLPECWWCPVQMMTVHGGNGCVQFVKDGGDATMVILKGEDIEGKVDKGGSLPDPACTYSAESKCILQLLRDPIPADMTMYSRMVTKCKYISEEIVTDMTMSKEMAVEGELLSPAINNYDCATTSKVGMVYGCEHSLPDGIVRVVNVMIGGKRALVRGGGDVDKGSAFAVKGTGALVLNMEIDSINALPACMEEGSQFVTLDPAMNEVDIFTTSTGSVMIITLEHMKKMMNTLVTRPGGDDGRGVELALVIIRTARRMPPVGIAGAIDSCHGVVHAGKNTGAIHSCHGLVHGGKNAVAVANAACHRMRQKVAVEVTLAPQHGDDIDDFANVQVANLCATEGHPQGGALGKTPTPASIAARPGDKRQWLTPPVVEAMRRAAWSISLPLRGANFQC
jgi:adenosylhomocysteinase